MNWLAQEDARQVQQRYKREAPAPMYSAGFTCPTDLTNLPSENLNGLSLSSRTSSRHGKSI